MGRPARAALMATAVATVLVAGVCLTAPTVYRSIDYLRFHEPMHVFGARAIREGRLPLWNPHVNLGRPHMADLQSGVLYPTFLLDLVAPQPVAFFATAVIHIALGALGMFFLGTYLGMTRGTAWVVAFAFFLSGSVSGTLHTGSIECVQAIAYLPWALWLAARLQEQRRAKEVAALAGILALQILCGHPQYSWLTGLAAGLFLAGRRLEPPFLSNARALLLDWGVLALASVWALALAAVAVLPFFDLVAHGNRAQRSLEFAASWSMPWIDWATLVRPIKSSFVVNWVDNLYPGSLVTLAGAVALTRVRQRNIRALLLVCAVSFVLAAGSRTPLFEALFHGLPGVSAFRLHARAALLIVLSLSLGAGLLLSRPREQGQAAWAVVVAVTLAALVAIATVELRLPPGGRSWSEAVGQAALVLAAGALLLVFLRRGLAATGTLGVILLVFTAADLARATARLKLVYRTRSDFPAEAAATAALDKRGLLRASQPPPRIAFPFPYVRENAGMLHGYSTFNGYVSLSLDRVWTYLHAGLGIEPPRILNTIPSNDIYHFGPFPYRSMNLTLGFDLATKKPWFSPAPDPRAYLALAGLPVPTWRDAIARMRMNHDFHQVALVEEQMSLGLPPVPPPGTEPCAARITEFAAERIAVATECRHSSLLVLAEAYHPGWTARVDGAPTPCLPANAWMRGVAVPAGRHTVVLSFEQRWIGLGAALSLAALVALLVVVLPRRPAGSHRARGGQALRSQ